MSIFLWKKVLGAFAFPQSGSHTETGPSRPPGRGGDDPAGESGQRWEVRLRRTATAPQVSSSEASSRAVVIIVGFWSVVARPPPLDVVPEPDPMPGDPLPSPPPGFESARTRY